MIDEEATFEKFGYYSTDLKPKSKKKLVAICDNCGKVRLVKKYAYSLLCKVCHYSRNGGKVKQLCLTCGIEFPVVSSRIKDGGGKFCSLKCHGKWKSENLKGENSPTWKGGLVKRICETCGTEFPVKPSHAKGGNGRFCSPECMMKWRSQSLRGENSPRWKGGEVKRICEFCATEFHAQPSEIKKGRGKFCSPKCKGKWMSKNLRGKNSANWQGGISFEPYCSKFNEEFKEYIREKLGRICFLCQKTEKENGRRLSVHHVNYNKGCGCDDDETCQFVPLCISCNSKVNKNRKEWEAKIKAMLKNKLNGWYI